MRQGFDRGVILGIMLMAAMMVGIATTSYLNTRQLRANDARAARSREVIDAIGAIRADTRKLQAAQRAFLISGLPDWRAPYHQAVADLHAGVARVERLTADDPDQRPRLEAAEREIRSGIARMDEVAERRREGIQVIVEMARANGPRSFVDPVLDTLTEMDAAERARLAERERAADAAYTRAVLNGTAGAVLGLVALGLFVWLVRRSAAAQARAAARIAAQRELLDATLTSIGDAVLATDTAGRVTFLNPVAEALTGWPTAEAAGRDLDEVFRVVNATTGAPVENPARRALARGLVVGPADHAVLVARDGTRRPIDDSAAPIRDAAGRTSGAVLVFRDVTDRTRAAAALAEVTAQSQRRKRLYETALSNTPDLVYVFDLEHRFTYANEALLATWGKTWDEAIGKTCRELGYEAWHAALHDREIDQVVATKRPIRGEVPFTGTNGPRVYDYILVPVLGADGGVEAVAGTTRDVTDRKRAEVALREKEEQARDILESITDAFVAVGRDWRFTYVNRVAEQVLDRRPGDLPGRSLWDEFPGLIGSPFEPAYRAAMAAGTAAAVTAFYPDHARWYEVHVYPAADGITIYFRDATERVANELARKESEERYRRAAAEAERAAEANAKFRAFFEQGSTFAAVLSPDGVVLEANRLWLDACGCAREDVTGRPFWECGWWGRSAAPRAAVRAGAARAAAGDLFRAETPYDAAGGGERILDLSLAPVTDAAGRVLFLAATGADVTERRRMEDALRDADRRKDDFIALLAHELRNPLAPIRNGLQVIRLAGGDAAAVARARDMMERQLGHMVRLVDDLLDVSRIDRNKMELRRARIALADAIAAAVETARPLIDEARHALTVTLPDAAVYLDADLTRLAQVFSNLLTNSAKYTPPGGAIAIAARADGATVGVTVADTGIGIPAESLPNIFDMFWQVNRSAERSAGGLGIGLALVRGVVELHGGTVVAASAGPGRGSTFTVTLPVAADQPAAADGAGEARRPTPGGCRRVLVVDDNRDAAESMADMLALLGDEVRTAHDGLEAVAAAEPFRPDVILMDVGMPRLNGLDATRRIREQPWGRTAVIVALTGWGQDNDRERSRAAGCDGHLVKPVTLADLEQLLARLPATRGDPGAR
jgi:PAS domain S-box-containing protein